MKRLVIFLLSIQCAMALLCGVAFADTDGIFDLQTEENVAVIPQLANGNTITADESGMYSDAQRMELTYSDVLEDGADYLVMVLEGDDTTPSVENIVYMDQCAADSTSISFNIYPKQLTSGKTYHIFQANNSSESAGMSEIASFQYGTGSAFILGDVNGDGEVDNADVMYLARWYSNWDGYTISDTRAADVNGDGEIDNADVMYLARWYSNWEGYTLG